MPIGDRTLRRHRRERGARASAWGTAAFAVLALGLAGCKPLVMAARPEGTAASGSPAPAATPITTEKLSAPVALAPSFTGGVKAATPQHAAAAKSASASPAAAPPPKKTPRPAGAVAARPAAPLSPAKPPPAAVVAATAAAKPPGKPAPPGVTCPPGTLGLWTKDVIEADVYICRTLHPQ